MATGGASGTAPSRQTIRLNAEFETLLADPLPFVDRLKFEAVDKLNHLSGVIFGPKGSDYEGGHFKFLIEFPPEYPFKPPKFAILTPICHPNVDSAKHDACLDQLMATWKPSIKLRDLLTELHGLLAEPNYDIPIENDPLVTKSPALARQLTQEHAKPSDQ